MIVTGGTFTIVIGKRSREINKGVILYKSIFDNHWLCHDKAKPGSLITNWWYELLSKDILITKQKMLINFYENFWERIILKFLNDVRNIKWLRTEIKATTKAAITILPQKLTKYWTLRTKSHYSTLGGKFLWSLLKKTKKCICRKIRRLFM